MFIDLYSFQLSCEKTCKMMFENSQNLHIFFSVLERMRQIIYQVPTELPIIMRDEGSL
jgi:hypothetical protein